jgi:hypothetical protein
MSCESISVAEPVISDLDLAELAAVAGGHPTRGCTDSCTMVC